mgnify:CR=1 FL=1
MHPNEGLTYDFVFRDAPIASRMIHIHIMFLPVWLIKSVLACVPVSFLEGALRVCQFLKFPKFLPVS